MIFYQDYTFSSTAMPGVPRSNQSILAKIEQRTEQFHSTGDSVGI